MTFEQVFSKLVIFISRNRVFNDSRFVVDKIVFKSLIDNVPLLFSSWLLKQFEFSDDVIFSIEQNF